MSLLNGILKYWPIIVFCGVVISQWVRNEMQVNDLKDCVKELNDDLKIVNARMNVFEKTNELVQVSLATINTNIEYIKEGIKELKNK